jgi:hypothetical protein
MPVLKSESKTRKLAAPPLRDPHGTLIFADRDDFRPNLSPHEVLKVSSLPAVPAYFL